MFLLWSPFPPYTSVLHTGDMRADDGFIQDLIRNPLVQPFLQSYPVKHKTGSGSILKDRRLDATDFRPMFPGPHDHPGSDDARKPINGNSGLQRRLDRIYLDTSLFVGSCDMPSREEAVGNLIQLINGFPADTVFHLHCWTFGYEEVLKALARTYDTRIHLDRWQLQNHLLLHGDPLLQQLGTSDRSPLFHACEGDKGRGCEAVKNTRRRLVRVEFIEEHVVEHAVKMKHIMKEMRLAQVGEANWPTKIVSPSPIYMAFPLTEHACSCCHLVLPLGTPCHVTRARGSDQSLQASIALAQHPNTSAFRMRLLYDEASLQEHRGRWRGQHQAGMSRLVCARPRQVGSGG